eukprot:TRINITY_DN46159_c0_g1_i1.p1 TRINITY_DN46159_c0_g1~~TRINITY_DN46159_c0_g1_i1.p1  ORF type:complete len:163 (+),score=30.96 TRINITY_DN46159_c0_g1_i1:23-490(+)
MGQQAAKIPARPVVAQGKTRICVAGFGFSHHTHRAGNVARAIVQANPDQYESWFHFNSRNYPELLRQVKSELPENQQKQFADHKSAPFCWLELADGTLKAKGGRDGLCQWVLSSGQFSTQRYDEVLGLASSEVSLLEAWVDKTPGTAPGQREETE